jgi:excisionase family DNA binding protein
VSVDQIATTGARVKAAERLLTLAEIQEAAGVSRATVFRWRHERGLKMVKVGGCVRIRETDWRAFLEKNTHVVTPSKEQAA